MKLLVNKRHLFVILSVILFFIILNIKGLTVGKLTSDFRDQHIRIIEYFRINFAHTNDLLPQISLNHGLSMNFAIFYYYGWLNPIVMLAVFFSFIPLLYSMQLIMIILVLSTYFATYIYLSRYKMDSNIIFIISCLMSIAPPMLFHFSTHPMFIYYFPIFIISLIGLDYLIEKQKYLLFIISYALVFFTNFFFAPVVAYIHFAYLIIKCDSIKESKVIIKYSLAFIISVLLGMLILYPQILIVLTSNVRSGDVSLFSIMLFKQVFTDIVYSGYSMGLGIIGVFVIAYLVLDFKNKQSRKVLLFLIPLLLFAPLNLILNALQYHHQKINIYTTIVLLLLLAFIMHKNDTKKIKYALIVSFVYLILISILRPNGTNYLILIVMVSIQSLVINYRHFNIMGNYLYVMLVVLIVFNIFYNTKFITHTQFNEVILNTNLVVEDTSVGQRTNNPVNFISNIDDLNVTVYTSIMNQNYNDFFTNEIELSQGRIKRRFLPMSMDNTLLRNFLSINNNLNDFIYIVNDSSIYNPLALDKMTNIQRLVSYNQGVFMEDVPNTYDLSKQDFIYDIIPNSNIIVEEKLIKIDVADLINENSTVYVEIIINDQKVKNEVFTLLDNEGLKTSYEHYNDVQNDNFYQEGIDNKAVFIVDVNNNIKELTFTHDNKNTELVINAYVINLDKLNNSYLDYTNVFDLQVLPNKGYRFSSGAGLIATTIPFDQGFTVTNNGRELELLKVNNNFLAFKLDDKHNDVQINYSMPGQKAGLIMSLIGLIMLSFIIIKEVPFFSKYFYRFILVGVINTLNYILAYQLFIKVLPYGYAHILAFILSALISYVITSYYTFSIKPTWKTFIAFPLTFLPNLIFSLVGTIILVETNMLDKSIASLVMMILIIPVTYIINKMIFITRQ